MGCGGGPNLLNGRQSSTWRYGSSALELYYLSATHWTAQPGSYFIYVEKEETYTCDGQTTFMDVTGCTRQKMEYSYDDSTGNLTEQREYDKDDLVYRLTKYLYTNPSSNFSSGLLWGQAVYKDSGASGNEIAHTEFYYDGHTDPYQPPTEGNLTRQREWATGLSTSNPIYRHTDYDHDSYGNVTEVTVSPQYSGGQGSDQVTITDFGPHGLLPVVVTNTLGHRTETTYDYRFQAPKTVKDVANNALTSYTYDDFGRLKTMTSPGCGDGKVTFEAHYPPTTLSFPISGQPYYEKTLQRVDACNGGGSYAETVVYYDGLGRQIQSRSPGDTSGSYIVTDMKYDQLGRVTQTSLPHQETGATFSQPGDTWNTNKIIRTDYDPLDRVTQVTQPDTSTTKTFYNGHQTAVIDANSHMTISETDDFGRLRKVKEYAETFTSPSWSAAVYATTTYDYDELNNLIQVIDAQGNVTDITYDRLSRKTEMNDPDMGRWYYHYDALGNLIAQVDAKATATNLYYDDLNRLTDKTYQLNVSAPVTYSRSDPPVPGSNPHLQYFYDEAGHGAGVGRRTRMIDEAGTVEWSYDPQGRVTEERRRFDQSPYTGVLTNTNNLNYPTDTDYVTSFTYDMADRVRTVTYPDGEQVTTDYTLRGLPTTLATDHLVGPAQYITGATHDALAHLTSRTAGNEVSTTYDYYSALEENNRLRQIRVSKDGINRLNLTYETYDAVGNIKEIWDNSASLPSRQTLTFTYDHLDRLLTADAAAVGEVVGFDHDYLYDKIGNITERDGQSYSYPASGPSSVRPHAVTSVGTNNTYRYDANGNMDSRTEAGATYSQAWTLENKLGRVTWIEPSTQQPYTTTFVYDGDGNRLLKIEGLPDPVSGGTSEVTTLYIGGIYEEQFNTTEPGLGGYQTSQDAGDPGSQGAGELVLSQPPSHPASPPVSLSRITPGLATPLLTMSLPAVQTAMIEIRLKLMTETGVEIVKQEAALLPAGTGLADDLGHPGRVFGGSSGRWGGSV